MTKLPLADVPLWKGLLQNLLRGSLLLQNAGHLELKLGVYLSSWKH